MSSFKKDFYLNATLIIGVIIIIVYIVRIYTVDPVIRRRNDFKPVETQSIRRVNFELSQIPVYIINMPNRIDRKEHMINLMNTLGFNNYTFVSPVPKEEAIKHPLMKKKKLYPSQASNTLTFMKILSENSKNKSFDKFFIMEDDIDIYYSKSNMNKIYNASKNVNWDLLYFEFCFADCRNTIKLYPDLYKLYYNLCAGCILYTNKAAEKLVSNFTGDVCADEYYANMTKAGKIQSYGFPLFRQNPKFGSDLKGSFKNIVKNTFDLICRPY